MAIAEELRARAKDALLTLAIASEEELGAHEPAEDLLTMEATLDKVVKLRPDRISCYTYAHLPDEIAWYARRSHGTHRAHRSAPSRASRSSRSELRARNN